MLAEVGPRWRKQNTGGGSGTQMEEAGPIWGIQNLGD